MGYQVAGKSIREWKQEYPLLQSIIDTKEVFWSNPKCNTDDHVRAMFAKEIDDAEARLTRFASYLSVAFPETSAQGGMIESPMQPIGNMANVFDHQYGVKMEGSLWLKCDHQLPISGSIKARGGIYEVLKYAESLAMDAGLLRQEDDYAILANDSFRTFFSQYKVAVGSTGNLGLSIGMMSAKLGFRVTVHMSSDAKAWKKDLLRRLGVEVIEYEQDYSAAVEAGRKAAERDPYCHFVDDENSLDLFLGYAVAAKRLQRQLEERNILVDEEHPLFLYVPCGVGGGPGGVAFGVKQIFGANAHCFFAEPTHAPCMLLGLMTGLHDDVSVQDFGIELRTAADGLAVGRASRFVGKVVEPILSGCYTVEDEQLYRLLYLLHTAEGIALEPSAVAGLYGPIQLLATDEGKAYVKQHHLSSRMSQATHIVWATGGSMVPEFEMKQDIKRGKAYFDQDNVS